MDAKMMHGFFKLYRQYTTHSKVYADMSVVYAGYGDVSWNNPSMVTPNIEKMAR
jgi:hypothetical protein